MSARDLKNYRKACRGDSSSDSDLDRLSPPPSVKRATAAMAKGQDQSLNLPVDYLRRAPAAPLTVEKFQRSATSDILAWFFRMENHFRVAGIPEEEWVYSIISNMHQNHFLETYALHKESYPTFRSKVITMYKQPNMQAAVMAEWTQARQLMNEDLQTFMFRIQEMGEKAFAGFPDSHKQQLAVFAFCRGMLDDKAAQLVMLHAKNQVHKAVKTATSLFGRTHFPLVAAPEPLPPVPQTPPKLPKAKYQAYAAVEQEEPDTLQRDDEYDVFQEGEDYGDHVENDHDAEYDEYGMVETDQESAPPNRGRQFNRGRGRGRGSPRGRGGPLICRQCGGRGHFARTCPSPATSPGRGRQNWINRVPRDTCRCCGRPGHWQKDCPEYLKSFEATQLPNDEPRPLIQLPPRMNAATAPNR